MDIDWPKLDTIELADPEYHTPNKIDLLLGAEVYGEIILDGLIKYPSGSLVAQNTTLGWILSGYVKSEPIKGNFVTMHTKVREEEFQLDELIKQFWEAEAEPKLDSKILTEEEKKCEELYGLTTRRDEEGRYIVKLPFRKEEEPACLQGQSKQIALRRFYALEKKLMKNPTLKEEFKKNFDEYLTLNHMGPVNIDTKNIPAVYLPYHAVVRENRDTTKVRVVFDASCKGSNGVSLNDDLMVGPKLQSDLRHIVMRWRIHPICFTADIIKMYRQIKVDEDDTNFQRILWREDPNADIEEYKLLRLTFGTSSAPYLAVKSLIQLALDEGTDFELAAEIVKRDFYMDDLMSGSQNEEEAIEIYKQLNKLMKKGGFELQKWSSNSKKMLDVIKENKIKVNERLEVKLEAKNKILGLTWNRRTDEFEYEVQIPPVSPPITKRKVVADIARLYDPLGWIAPTIVSAKILIQRLWSSGIDWDQELPPQLIQDWSTYREGLLHLTNFHIPRWVCRRSDDKLVELHGFCDASTAAYGAAVYMRVIDANGGIHVSLITAKTKVASNTTIVTIPRLELCGAVLVTKLLMEVSQVLNVPKKDLHAWTDSQIVLAWLSSHPSRWQTYVANRVSQILQHLNRNQWSYIKSEQNPADHASRGLKPQDIINDELWLNGPVCLKQTEIQRNDLISTTGYDTKLEEKKSYTYAVQVEEDDSTVWWKFSSLTKMLRVIAYCRRFLKQNKPKQKILEKDEIEDALKIIIKKCQSKGFKDELKDINEGKEVNRKSKLVSFNPFLDEFGILRIGGRIQRAQLNETQKHPILLPHDSPLSQLLVADAHKNTLHGGPQLMRNYLRQKYWIFGDKNLVKAYVRKCITCIRYAGANNSTPLMGQLPAARVTPTRAFKCTGVDYAGPINIRVSKGRGNKSYKGYICLFICMATRAIHLEAVTDMTSEGFLAAFKRFVARRGHCSDLYSDNGSNFIGAARELEKIFKENARDSELAEWLANKGTKWHFIPPHAPNFGGLWEAGIKSTKHHLKRIIGDYTLTFEEISTVLAQIEACLNSRPITPLPEDNGETLALTPGHFLIGEPILLAPERNCESSTISSLRRWNLCQRMVQEFWRRWSEEYLTHFLQRHKWAYTTPEPKIGDVVLVKEDDLPPAKWLLGRIMEKHPGLDKVTRVVS